MKKIQIFPGYKLVLENGNSFMVKGYKDINIIFPEGSNHSSISLDELCDEELNPKKHMSRIVKVFDGRNVLIWERILTRTGIRPGFMMVNEEGIHYLVVECGNTLRIMSTDHFFVGAKLSDIMNEDMSPAGLNYATIIEVKNKEGKVVYSKE